MSATPAEPRPMPSLRSPSPCTPTAAPSPGWSRKPLPSNANGPAGRFPFLQVRYSDLLYKIKQVLREKLGTTGVSTQLVKDQYGVIRRIDIDAVAKAFHPGTRVVYFRPQNPADDHTVRVQQVQTRLDELGKELDLTITVIPIPGGSHASAESNPNVYRHAIDGTADR